jgi:beta-lactamase superfamily II metal-dependent hydrolase
MRSYWYRTYLVVNAVDLDGNAVNVHFGGRRNDCASNDLSVGILVKYGDFCYLVAGDFTGNSSEKVADVEELIKGDAANLDCLPINHHGSKTSSSDDFMQASHPIVVIVSNGKMHGHPHRSVIENNILTMNPAPAVYLTNRNPSGPAWSDDPSKIADDDFFEYEGAIPISGLLAQTC